MKTQGDYPNTEKIVVKEEDYSTVFLYHNVANFLVRVFIPACLCTVCKSIPTCG